jgi:hypothetical protein
MSIIGTPNTTKTVQLKLAWPFVSQGAMPLHVYKTVTVVDQGGQTCFLPGQEILAFPNIVTMQTYRDAGIVGPGDGSGYTGGVADTLTIDLSIPIDEDGFVYVNQHLDDGLKGPGVDIDGDGLFERYTKDADDDALAPGTTTVLIPELADHRLCVLEGTTEVGCDMVENDNEFKKNTGVGGMVTSGGAPFPAPPGATMHLYNPMGVLVGVGRTGVTGTDWTDADGWYVITYKHTGPRATYRVELIPPGGGTPVNQLVELKSNAYVEVPFALP